MDVMLPVAVRSETEEVTRMWIQLHSTCFVFCTKYK